jgi:hypothetical protein
MPGVLGTAGQPTNHIVGDGGVAGRNGGAPGCLVPGNVVTYPVAEIVLVRAIFADKLD